jgi:CRP-like cAMP-binding protein
MYQELKAAIAQHTSLSEEEYNEVLSRFILIEVPSKTILVKLDHVASELYFITRGAVRNYILPDVEEIHMGFYFENSFVSSVKSFLDRAPSKQVVETLEDTELLCLSRDDYEMLNNRILRMNEFSRKLIENFLIMNNTQTESLLLDQSQERFQKMIKVQPYLLNRVPHRYLASYLEIPLLYFSQMIERHKDL